jgi:hypothetical protein
MIEVRNAYGFPIVERFKKAQQYAAEVRARKPGPHHCQACRMNEMLPAVQQITKNWSKE